MFHQVFVELQYSIIPHSLRPALIVDAGANIGLSACYLLSRFPEARLIGIEPDASNLELARENLAPYGDRAVLVHGAVWSESAALDLHQPGNAATDQWAIKVLPASTPRDTSVRGYTLDEILVQARANKGERILLKMDIEGAERFVFAAASDALIEAFAAIAIEFHGEDASDVFLARTAGKFSFATRGETTYAERPKPTFSNPGQ